MSGTDYITTPNLGLYKPFYDKDDGAWGGHLNANADVLDALLGSGGAATGPWLPLSGGAVVGVTTFSSTTTLSGGGTFTGTYAGTHTYSGALTFSGSVTGTGLSTYLASPPAIGGTTAAAGTFTTLRATGNCGFNNTAPIAKPAGWGAPTGTATRTTFVTGSVTLSALAEHVKALVDDLTAYGLIGP